MVGPLKGAWLCLSILSAITKRRHHTFETVTLGTIYHVYLCLVSQLICVLPASHSVHSSHTFKDIVLLCVTCHLSLSLSVGLISCTTVSSIFDSLLTRFFVSIPIRLCLGCCLSLKLCLHTHTHIYIGIYRPLPLYKMLTVWGWQQCWLAKHHCLPLPPSQKYSHYKYAARSALTSLWRPPHPFDPPNPIYPNTAVCEMVVKVSVLTCGVMF